MTEHREQIGGRGGVLAAGEWDAGAVPVLYLHGVPNSCRPLGAVPRAHRRLRARPARLRAVGQAGLLRLLDPRLRPLDRGVPGSRRPRPLLAGGARLGRGRPGHRAAAARAAGAAGGDRRRALPPRLRVAQVGAHLAHAVRGGDGDGAEHEVGGQAARCPRSWSTRCGRTSTTAPSGRSSSSTARRRPRCSRARARTWARSTARRWCSPPTPTPTSGPSSGAAYAEALGNAEHRELEGAGHWPWLDRPELVDDVAAFLAG